MGFFALPMHPHWRTAAVTPTAGWDVRSLAASEEVGGRGRSFVDGEEEEGGGGHLVLLHVTFLALSTDFA